MQKKQFGINQLNPTTAKWTVCQALGADKDQQKKKSKSLKSSGATAAPYE